MLPPNEPLSDQVFHKLLSLMRVSRQLSHQISETRGISPPQLSVLRYLMETGPLQVGQIQAYLHKSPSTTSALIDQLEGKGYVKRARSEEDQRVVMVGLTTRGQQMAMTVPLEGLPRLRWGLREIPHGRLTVMLGVLDELLTIMKIEGDVNE
jgi:DNA-binding MarR family transcriptional regulator